MSSEYAYVISEDGSHRIAFGEDALPVQWMTRRDLHAWVWAQPIAAVSDMFGMIGSVGWQCYMYDICRPPAGYFNRLRAGRNPEVEALPTSRGPDEPVPLADFDHHGPPYTLLCNPKFHPDAQLGPPDADGLIYPRSSDALLAVCRTKNAKQRIRSSGLVDCPPKPLTRAMLAKIAWGLGWRVDEETLERYGLTKHLLVKLLEREGVASFPPFRQWSKWDWGELKPFRMKRHRLTPKHRLQLVELSSEIRTQLQAEIDDELRRDAERAAAVALKARETLAARRKYAIERLPAIALRVAAGDEPAAACREEGASVSAVTYAIKRRFREQCGQALSREERVICRAFERNHELDPLDSLLLSYICAEQNTVAYKGVSSAWYADKAIDLSRLKNLAGWLVAAGEVNEASSDLEEALSACREHLASCRSRLPTNQASAAQCSNVAQSD